MMCHIVAQIITSQIFLNILIQRHLHYTRAVPSKQYADKCTWSFDFNKIVNFEKTKIINYQYLGKVLI